MSQQPLDVRLQVLLPIIRGLAEMFGPDCEVVLHDVTQLPHSIVAIENGSVSGRRVGDVPTDRMLRSLRHADDTQDVRLYVSSHDGKILKSLAVTLRDEGGEPYGLLGLNYDISEVVQAQRTLAKLTAVGRLGGEAAPEAGEIFAGDIRDVLAGMVTAILGEMGKTPASMSREEKMEVVKRLEERGAFLVKRSAEQIAEALDLSRYTIFSYLKEIRRGDDETVLLGSGEGGPDAITSGSALGRIQPVAAASRWPAGFPQTAKDASATPSGSSTPASGSSSAASGSSSAASGSSAATSAGTQ